MTELEKDLEAIVRGSANGVDDPSLVWVEVRNGSCQEGIPTYNIAARLDELGYVKVVRCEECKFWGSNDKEHLAKCSFCAGWAAEGLGLCYGPYGANSEDGLLTKAEDFCPYGVPVVAKPVPGEEEKE